MFIASFSYSAKIHLNNLWCLDAIQHLYQAVFTYIKSHPTNQQVTVSWQPYDFVTFIKHGFRFDLIWHSMTWKLIDLFLTGKCLSPSFYCVKFWKGFNISGIQSDSSKVVYLYIFVDYNITWISLFYFDGNCGDSVHSGLKGIYHNVFVSSWNKIWLLAFWHRLPWRVIFIFIPSFFPLRTAHFDTP